MEEVADVDWEEIKKIRGSSLLSVFPWRLPNSQLMSLMTQKQGELEANKQNRKKHFQSKISQTNRLLNNISKHSETVRCRLLFHVGFLLRAQIPLCDSGTNRFGSSSEQFDWLGTDHHCAQFCFEKVDLTSSKGSLIIATALPRAFKPHQPATAISTNVGT